MRRGRRAVLAVVLTVSLAAAACGRDEGDTESRTPTTAAGGDGSTTTAAGSDNRLDNGSFGDIEQVCSDGDAAGATDVGVTDESIQVGTLTDKGFTGSPGLIAEMYDAAVAFAAWCNEHGGISGRELVIADRDAAIVDYNARIIDAWLQPGPRGGRRGRRPGRLLQR
jgi:hypothetical protein